MTGRRKDLAKREYASRVPAPHTAKRSLGQNFLVDENISRKIVSALQVVPGDHVIEIGPGKGALTRLLAKSGARVTAVEKDSRLAADLRQSLAGYSNLEVLEGDFLEFSFPSSPARCKVIGNIPYNLTSRIVSRLVDERQRIESAVLMIQDEVARRLAASPGTKEYGAISIRLQIVSDVEKLFIVTPQCFRPRPKVDSRVVRFVFKTREPLGDEVGFVRFVKAAFGMRRKMFRHFVVHSYGKRFVDLLEEKYRTGRVETFDPTEIYRIFAILESNARDI